MKKQHIDADSVMNNYTQSQINFDNLNARDSDERELRYHLSQIHKLLYILVDKIDKLK